MIMLSTANGKILSLYVDKQTTPQQKLNSLENLLTPIHHLIKLMNHGT